MMKLGFEEGKDSCADDEYFLLYPEGAKFGNPVVVYGFVNSSMNIRAGIVGEIDKKGEVGSFSTDFPVKHVTIHAI